MRMQVRSVGLAVVVLACVWATMLRSPVSAGGQSGGAQTASACPDRRNVNTGEHLLWRAAAPGLAHSSPVVWGNRRRGTRGKPSPNGRSVKRLGGDPVYPSYRPPDCSFYMTGDV